MIDMATLTAIEAADAMRTGTISALDCVEHILARVTEQADLKAIIAFDPEAVRRAAADADLRRERGETLGALHGVPFVVKDNIDVAGLPATAGTPALAGNRPTRDAEVVARLRGAGAIVLGKANMHELAAGVTTSNAAYGIARNPYDRDLVPGGSSGGTAAAIAARLCPIGLGTDTGASNRLPAAWCGLIGFRPSAGRWSQQGLIMTSSTRDTIGPMARTMADIVLAEEIVTGTPAAPVPAIKGMRLGVPRDPFWDDLDPRVARATEAVLDTLRQAGVTLVEAPLVGVDDLAMAAGRPISMAENAVVMTRYLAAAGSTLSPADVVAGIASPDVRAFYDHFITGVTETEYQEALTVHRVALQALFHDWLDRNRVDAMIFPTSPIMPPPIGRSDESHHNGRTLSTLWLAVRNTNPGSIAGIPGLSLPAGISDGGVPIGIEIDGRIGDDAALLAIGRALEPLLPTIPPPAL